MNELPTHPDILGRAEVATLLGVAPATVDKWRQRGGFRGRAFPDPRWQISRQPAWLKADVEAWREAVGR